MRIPSAIFALFAILSLAASGEAEAVSANPPVKAQSCRTVAAQVGGKNMWGASFYGERKDFWDVRWPYRNAPCFKSQQSCKAWLYWAQTYYWEMMQFQPCRKGGY
jgi:hypothetical protein